MPLSRRLCAGLQSVRVWLVLGVLAPLGMLIVSGFMLYDLRREMWTRAEETSANLLRVIERDMARNIGIMDHGLLSVIERLRSPVVMGAPEELRRLVLFDNIATAEDMGIVGLFGEDGASVLNSHYPPGAGGDYADRDYFQAHRASADVGLFVSKPYLSRMTGAYSVAFSRRINKPDGSFGGVVAASLKLSYFTRLIERVGLRRDDAIALTRQDGIRILRYPYNSRDIGADVSQAPNFQRIAREGSGSFTQLARRDGLERMYTFMPVGDLPLVLVIGIGTEDILGGWRNKALTIGLILIVLCGLTIALALFCGRELRRRAATEAKLARLSMTDGLTGLPNRRHFDEALQRAWDGAARTGRPLCLLIVDADHFKRFNDRYGHAVGDEILRGLARCFAKGIRPSDLVCRIGGEEFAAILPDTDEDGAMRVAERLHAEVATLLVDAVDISAGTITVSIGLTCASPAPSSVGELYRAADTALYAAKSAGRNRTCRSISGPAGAAPADYDSPHTRLAAPTSLATSP